jgi:beta-phosphoglucomutase
MTFGVCWDMDGVLADTGEFHYRTWDEVLSRRNIPFSRERFDTLFGMNNADTLAALLGGTPPPELTKSISGEKEALFRSAIRGKLQPLPGVLTWLRVLREKGMRQALASSAPQANIDAMLDALGMYSYFDAVVSSVQMRGKPAPDVFLRAAQEMGLPPDRCLVIEDSVAGVEAARRAGMACIAVTTTNPAQALRGADVVVDSLADLDPAIVESLIEAAG